VRRESLVVFQPVTTEELAARFPPAPRHETFLLVRRQGTPGFRPAEGELHPGDEVVIYEFNREAEADLRALNASFTPSFYTAKPNPAWPDELAIIAEAIPPSRSHVLEVCCGAGRLAGSLVRDDNRVVAVDVSAACLAHARAHDPHAIDWLTCDALALPFPDGSFDVSCMFENSLGVLFSGKAAAVEEVIRVARHRVILGLRETEDSPKVHTYWSRAGFMEAAETFTPDSAQALIDGLPASVRGRIASRRHVVGHQRPWGGRAFFVVLELAGAGD
jgi:SAM-dependent methyltransferase